MVGTKEASPRLGKRKEASKKTSTLKVLLSQSFYLYSLALTAS